MRLLDENWRAFEGSDEDVEVKALWLYQSGTDEVRFAHRFMGDWRFENGQKVFLDAFRPDLCLDVTAPLRPLDEGESDEDIVEVGAAIGHAVKAAARGDWEQMKLFAKEVLRSQADAVMDSDGELAGFASGGMLAISVFCKDDAEYQRLMAEITEDIDREAEEQEGDGADEDPMPGAGTGKPH
jgi:predicted esterase